VDRDRPARQPARPGPRPVPGAGSARGRQDHARAGTQRGPAAVCCHQGNLVLAWTGTDHRVNILTGAEQPLGTPVRRSGWTGRGPGTHPHSAAIRAT
jgi:hypothetical protein